MDCLEPPQLRVNSLRIQAAAAAAAGTTSVSNNESSSNAAAPSPVNASTTPPPGKPGRKRKRTDTPGLDTDFFQIAFFLRKILDLHEGLLLIGRALFCLVALSDSLVVFVLLCQRLV